MAFQVSPGVLVQERDITNIIPAVSTSIGAVAGSFAKGPVDEIVSICHYPMLWHFSFTKVLTWWQENKFAFILSHPIPISQEKTAMMR